MDTTFDILEALKRRGLKQVEISRRTRIPQPRLSKWARGHVPPGADDALKLRQLLVEQGSGPPDASASAVPAPVPPEPAHV